MRWNCFCTGYEVRAVPQVHESKKGTRYAAMRVENEQGYSDNIICRNPKVLMDLDLQKGDLIEFEAVANMGGKYPSFEIPENAVVRRVGD